MSKDDVLNGLEEIRAYWDPHMSEHYFRKYILPELKKSSILFSRPYKHRNVKKIKVPYYYTYKHLLTTVQIRLNEQTQGGGV